MFDYLFERRTIKFDGYGGEETLGGAGGGGNVLSQYSVPKKKVGLKKKERNERILLLCLPCIQEEL